MEKRKEKKNIILLFQPVQTKDIIVIIYMTTSKFSL